MKKIVRILLLSLLSCALIVAAAASYLYWNSRPAAVIVQKLIAYYFPAGSFRYESFAGNWANGLIFKNVVVKGEPHFPSGSVLRIQELRVCGSIFGEAWFQVQIENGRLKLPVSDTILINGRYDRGQVALSVYSPGIDLGEIRDILVNFQVYSNSYAGQVEGLDVRLEGPVSQISIQGKFQLEHFTLNRFTADNVPGTLDLQAQLKNPSHLNGVMSFQQGEVHGPKTATVTLKPSRMLFHGEITTPVFEFKGKTRVTGVVIDVALGGTPQAPDLRLASEPPLPQTQLLAMVATNKSWAGTENVFGSQGTIPVDLAKDFIDYFAFSGLGSDLGKQLGISNLSLSVSPQEQGIDIQKDLTERISAIYGVGQGKDPGGLLFTTRKLGGQFRVTDSASIGVEQETKQPSLKSVGTIPAFPEQKYQIRYKQNF